MYIYIYICVYAGPAAAMAVYGQRSFSLAGQ